MQASLETHHLPKRTPDISAVAGPRPALELSQNGSQSLPGLCMAPQPQAPVLALGATMTVCLVALDVEQPVEAVVPAAATTLA